MVNKIAFVCLVIGASTMLAADKTYHVTILDNTTVEGKDIKAGSYKIQLNDQTAVFIQGKTRIEVPAHPGKAQAEYNETQVEYVNNSIHEIHVGGSTTKIVFANEGQASSGSR